MKEFPTNEWISVNQTYTNAKHDLILYHCLGPKEGFTSKTGTVYQDFYYDKVINIDYTQSEKAFGNIKKCIKHISIENKPSGWSHGNTQARNYKIHEWKSYYSEALRGIVYAIFNKLEIE